MKIEDVKAGDRCWVAYPESHGPDEHGQNATVKDVVLGFVYVHGYSVAWCPGINVFWTKPEPPPKPKRKVTKVYPGWISLNEFGWLERRQVGTAITLTVDNIGTSCLKATLTVEVEE